MNVQRGADGKLRPAEFYAVIRVKGRFPKRMLAAFRDDERRRDLLIYEALFPPIDFHGQRMTIVR